MSSSKPARPVVGQRIRVTTIYKGDEKRLLATAMGNAWPLHGTHYLRDSPRTKRLTRALPWRKPKLKAIHEGVASAMNVTVLRPDSEDQTGRLSQSHRIPDTHMKYFVPVDGRDCGICGSREILRITRFRQTAEVCRACNSAQPQLANELADQSEVEEFAALVSTTSGLGLPSTCMNIGQRMRQ